MSAFARVTLVLAMFLAANTAVTVASDHVVTFETTADLCMGSVAPYSQNNEGIESFAPIGNWILLDENLTPMDCREILRFNVASLGGIPDLRVNSISLKLTVQAAGSDVPMQPEIHAITAANRDWQEGTGNGYYFTANQTCYIAKQTGDIAGSVAQSWAGSAGLNTPGVDYDSTALATQTLYTGQLSEGQPVYFNFNGSSTQLTSLINSWVVDNYTLSQDNPGLLLFDPSTLGASNSRCIAFYTLQCTDPWSGVPASPASYRPQLIVNYSTPEPGTLILLATGLIGLLCYAWRRQR